MCDTGPNTYDNKQNMVIVTHIWQKLNTVEREVTRIVIDFWQLFSHTPPSHTLLAKPNALSAF